MGDERDAAVGGDDEPETEDAQVGPLLLGMAALGDRSTLVPRVDPGGEVCHVEHEARAVYREGPDHLGHDAALDLLDLLLADLVHRVPKAPVAERAGGQAQPALPGGLLPPAREGELGTRINHPVRRREGDVGPDRRPGTGATGAGDPVDDLRHLQPAQHLPHRSDVAEGEMTAAIRLTWSCLRQARRDLLGRAEIALRDDPGLAVDPGGLGQVVVRLAVLLLADDERHI